MLQYVKFYSLISKKSFLKMPSKNLLIKQKPTIFKIILSLFIAFVFVQSLFYKFSGSDETVYIFSTLDSWFAGIYKEGFFNKGGIFSANVIGSVELLSSSLLILALITKLTILRLLGALIAIGVISGAIFFHLFTPLGIVVFF